MEVRDYEPEDIQFGTRLHGALEAFDFVSAGGSEYDAHMKKLMEIDSNSGQAVKKAIETLLTSNIHQSLGLSRKAATKEVRIAHCIRLTDKDTNVTMKDKLDLMLADSSGRITIVDYKTNYPDAGGRWEDFVRSHYAHQLAAYKLALEDGAGFDVERTCILNYNRARNEWKLHDVDTASLELGKRLLDMLPLKVQDGGLSKRQRDDFCMKMCQFRELCWP